MGTYIVRDAAVYIESRRAGIPMERMENNNNNNSTKNTRRKIATVHKKGNRLSHTRLPHHHPSGGGDAVFVNVTGTRRCNSSSGPRPFVTWLSVYRACTRPLCVSDFNTNKRPELIYRPAVSHPSHMHIPGRLEVCHKFIGPVEIHVTIIFIYYIVLYT